MALGEEQKAEAIRILNRCRLGGLQSDIDFLDKNMKAQFKLATNLNARFVAIFGEQENNNGTINLKDQETGNEITVEKDQLYNTIIQELMKPSPGCSDCSSDDCDTCGEQEEEECGCGGNCSCGGEN
jgi:histidyl-tRNA synthetase